MPHQATHTIGVLALNLTNRALSVLFIRQQEKTKQKAPFTLDKESNFRGAVQNEGYDICILETIANTNYKCSYFSTIQTRVFVGNINSDI